MRKIETGILRGGQSGGLTFPILKEFVTIITEKGQNYYQTQKLDDDGNRIYEWEEDYVRNGGKI